MPCLDYRIGLALLAAVFLCASCASSETATGTAGTGGAAGVGGSGGTRAPSFHPPDELGPHAVGHSMFMAVDAARDDRELPVDVWYPVDEIDALSEPLTEYPLQSGFGLPSKVAVDDLPVSSAALRPLLIFSHGFGGINTQSTQLMEILASHGFIVASPVHTGNTSSDLSDPTPDASRVPDVSFVIDTMLERAMTVDDPFEARIDASLIGVLGHSFGGATAMGSVAGWAGAEADPRVDVIGVIAGSVDSGRFSEEVLGAVTAPTILMVGSLDSGAFNNHRYAFENMPAAEALFKVEVEGANHTHFANICDIGNRLIELGITEDTWPDIGASALIQPYNDTCTEDVFPIAEAHRLQNLYMVAHFRRHLLGDEGYDEYLSTSYADANEPAIDFVAQ